VYFTSAKVNKSNTVANIAIVNSRTILSVFKLLSGSLAAVGWGWGRAGDRSVSIKVGAGSRSTLEHDSSHAMWAFGICRRRTYSRQAVLRKVVSRAAAGREAKDVFA
jgi:hypothetical protein